MNLQPITEQMRKERAKNIAVMAKAKKEKAQEEEQKRIEFQNRVIEVERQEMK